MALGFWAAPTSASGALATTAQLPGGPVTAEPSNITADSATLRAILAEPSGPTRVTFRWGTSASSLDQSVATVAPDARSAAVESRRDVTVRLQSLAGGTTYYAQAIAESTGATAASPVVSFRTTQPLSAPLAPLSTPGQADRTPPATTVRRLPRFRGTIVRSGLPVTVTINEPGSVAVAIVDAGGNELSTVASGLASFRDAGVVSMQLRLTAEGKALLRGRTAVRWKVIAIATDGVGNTRRLTLPITIKWP